MVPTILLANSFIREAKNAKIKDLTPMKLQKLIYFTYGIYAAEYNEPLFSESFEAWQYGPVLSSVYQEFKVYRSSEIEKYATDAEGNAYALNWKTQDNQNLYRVFQKVVKKFENTSGLKLSELTHKKDTPWAKSYANGIIEFNKIKEYFVEHRGEYGGKN